jgi:hypothetical protein
VTSRGGGGGGELGLKDANPMVEECERRRSLAYGDASGAGSQRQEMNSPWLTWRSGSGVGVMTGEHIFLYTTRVAIL